MAAVIKPGASDTGPLWRKRMREAVLQAKQAGMAERDMWKLVMHVIEDEMRKRDAIIDRYRIFWCEYWTCSKCGEKTAQEPLWEPEL